MSQYEFNKEQNNTIDSLGKNMGFLGIMMLVHGVLLLISGLMALGGGLTTASLIPLIVGVIAVVAGVIFYRPTDNLRRIVKTEGNDISEMMTAMKEIISGMNIILFLAGIAILVRLASIFL